MFSLEREGDIFRTDRGYPQTGEIALIEQRAYGLAALGQLGEQLRRGGGQGFFARDGITAVEASPAATKERTGTADDEVVAAPAAAGKEAGGCGG